MGRGRLGVSARAWRTLGPYRRMAGLCALVVSVMVASVPELRTRHISCRTVGTGFDERALSRGTVDVVARPHRWARVNDVRLVPLG
jgi:hypothetical protein